MSHSSDVYFEHFKKYNEEQQRMYFDKVFEDRSKLYRMYLPQMAEMQNKIFELESENMHLKAVIAIYEGKL